MILPETGNEMPEIVGPGGITVHHHDNRPGALVNIVDFPVFLLEITGRERIIGMHCSQVLEVDGMVRIVTDASEERNYLYSGKIRCQPLSSRTEKGLLPDNHQPAQIAYKQALFRAGEGAMPIN